jgi:hypothetical protein
MSPHLYIPLRSCSCAPVIVTRMFSHPNSLPYNSKLFCCADIAHIILHLESTFLCATSEVWCTTPSIFWQVWRQCYFLEWGHSPDVCIKLMNTTLVLLHSLNYQVYASRITKSENWQHESTIWRRNKKVSMYLVAV